ncbi:MAG: hypothetical protein LUG57_03155 [Oscillospiraceae bacterium]|nr:hypothetical protein [Oscillospiraceae bacterium]
MKRLRAISILLALAMLVCLLPPLALADGESSPGADGPEEAETSGLSAETDGGEADHSEGTENEDALCPHGNPAADCAVCGVEARIAALPSAAEVQTMDAAEQGDVYAQASAVCDEYYALTQEEQAQLSNAEALFSLLDDFSGGVMLLAEEGSLCASCGAGYYDNGICAACGAYQSADLNESGVYEIGNAGQLFWFAAQVNGGSKSISAVLTADIDLNPGYIFSAADGSYTGSGSPRSWTPIGTSSIAYAGVFDGNGHTISGVYIKATTTLQGLFGYISGGTVQNVAVSNSSITGTKYIGGIAGHLVSGGTITGCVNNGFVEGTSTHTGGVLGYLNNNGTVSDCTNNGTVIGAGQYAGGVIGQASGSNTNIANCHNTGTVSGSGTYVGGVAGYIKDCASDITGCTNSGNVSGTSNYVGGIIGYASFSHSIMDCANEGTVTGVGNYAGGIVGYLSSGSISLCCNSGDISSLSSVGGIVGCNNSGTTIANCLNTGSISASSGNAGGIVGYLYKGTIDSCCSTGSVSGSNAGGVAGYIPSTGVIENSYFLDASADTGAVVYNPSTSSVEAESKTAAEFASGEVAWLLNGGESGTQIWKQTIGQDSAPSFSGETVYYDGDKGYYNTTQPTVYSVEITWGAMAFTYQEATAVWNPEAHEYQAVTESGAWSYADGANEITVTNSSNTSVTAAVSYQADSAYTAITGSFSKTASTLAADEADTFALYLSAPDESILSDLHNTVIGTVTVTITPG